MPLRQLAPYIPFVFILPILAYIVFQFQSPTSTKIDPPADTPTRSSLSPDRVPSIMEDWQERFNKKREYQTRKPGDLLGFNRPLNAVQDHSFQSTEYNVRPRFANAIQDWNGTPLTLRERRMISFMGEITDKPEWERKVFDEEIVEKWRKEAKEMEKKTEPERALSEKMFDYCITELRDYAEQQKKTGFIAAIDADAIVCKSDTIIPQELKDELKTAAAALEDVPDKFKDWHPDSDEKVLDLVHPSLFPLLYGRSRVLKDEKVPLDGCETYAGKGEIIPVPEHSHVEIKAFPGLSHWRHGEQHFYSKKYQWLPCEVALGENDTCKITSYINNLHPQKHQTLYSAIEKIIAKVIPMWDESLDATDFIDQPPRIDIDGAEWIETIHERDPEPDESEMDEDEIHELDEDWRRANRKLMMPEPGNYSHRQRDGRRWFDDPVGLRADYEKEGLQVIVKLANIHLTPEKPEYDGGSWHIEGQLNEHICASALYYYDSENITPSYLSFREAVSVSHLDDKPYEQDDYQHFEVLYDIRQHGPAVQTLGRVLTRENRMLTFPNVLQHQVSPFKLEDPTRPGHRKILALFLVDPHTRIPSTANVPPQQKDWWREMVMSLDRVGDLPPELADNVVDSAGDFPIELEEAKAIRKELMDERRLFVKDVEQRIREESFSFCEH